VIDFSALTLKLAAATEPNFTAVTPVKFVPEITIAVPPDGGPFRGLTFVTAGGPVYRNESFPLKRPFPVTTVDAAIRGVRVRVIELGLRIDVLTRGIELFVVEPLHDSTHDLYVL
jgi:hypothetical protein